MVNAKLIGIGAAAVILVTLVTVYGVSYMADFETYNDDVARIGAEEKTLESKIPLLGSQSAPITIIEVGDYQCEMCKKWFDETRPQIIQNYIETGKANLMFVDMPFLGSDSYWAAEATYCANDQEKYWEYHETLYELQQHVDDGWADGARLSAIALNLDLDLTEFENCMTNRDHADSIAANKQLAKKKFGANSTPTFLIVNSGTGNAEKIKGAHPYSTFEDIINSLV